MRPRTRYRLRYALRLVASVFLLSSPCSGGGCADRTGASVQVMPVGDAGTDRETFAPALRTLR